MNDFQANEQHSSLADQRNGGAEFTSEFTAELSGEFTGEFTDEFTGEIGQPLASTENAGVGNDAENLADQNWDEGFANEPDAAEVAPNEEPTSHGRRLRLQSTTTQQVDEQPALRAEIVLNQMDQRISSPTKLQSMLDPRQMKEVRKRVSEVHGEHAVEIAEMQIELAAERKKQQIQLEGERHRSGMRAKHTQYTGQLALQSTQLSTGSITQQLQSHKTQEQLIAGSRCSETDKEDLRILIDELTRRKIVKIASEHGVDAEK